MPRAYQNIGGAITLPTGCVDDESANSDRPLGVNKVRHLHKAGTNFGLDVNGTPVTREVIVYRANAPSTVKHFRACLEDTGTTTNISYDVKKYNDTNPTGITILSGVVNITHATADRAAAAGSIVSPALVAGDLLTIVQTVVSATAAMGPFAELEVDEPLV